MSFDYVDRLAFDEGFDVTGGNVHESATSFGRGPCYVGCDEASWGVEQGIVGSRWLGGKNVHSGCCNAAIVQGLGKCFFVHNGAA